MAKKALGLIETMGLVAAYGAADAALKAADVSLIGFDFPGHGGTTVKIEGEVAAVKFAVKAGVTAGERIYQVLSSHIIARPGDGIDPIIHIKKKGVVTKKTLSKKTDEEQKQ
jgi:ethanolamine utilization protein EutM